MRASLVAALLLLAGCRGCRHEHRRAPEAPGPAPSPVTTQAAAAASVVPTLPLSPDGSAELRALDRRIELHKTDPSPELRYLAEREVARGRVADYQAALALSAAWVAKSPTDSVAWIARAHALSAVHDFAAARAAVAHATGAGAEAEVVALDEATGHRDRSLPARAAAAQTWPSPITLTMYSASLALAGRFDEARALIPKAAALVRDNPPALFAWFYFQWGRVYEQAGDLATARAFYEASHARLPTVQATAHLVQTQLATGQQGAAKATVEAALVTTDRNPAILGVAVPLGLATVAEAKAAWERDLAALPLAFANHAARFYLGPGAEPARALVLARENLANRDTPEARALVVRAALAANDPTAACAAVDPLMSAPQRGDRFVAWQAVSRCGRHADAARLAKDLGIGAR